MTSTPRKPDTLQGVDDPVVQVALLSPLLLVVVGALAGAPRALLESFAATLLVAAFAVSLARGTRPALVLLILLAPFFLGEGTRPWIWFYDVATLATLAVGAVRLRRARSPIAVPAPIALAAWVAAAFAAVPLDLSNLLVELRYGTPAEVLRALSGCGLESAVHTVRFLGWTVAAAGLLLLATNVPWTRAVLSRLAAAVTILLLAVSACGIVLAQLRGLASLPIFTLSLGGQKAGGAIAGAAGFGWNVGWWAELLLALLPLAALPLLDEGTRRAKALSFAALAALSCAVLFTYQRGAYAVFCLEIGLLAIVASRRGDAGARSGRRLVAAAGGVLAFAVTVALLSPAGRTAMLRFQRLTMASDDERLHLLVVAGRMFGAHPFLGVGSGRFAWAFHEFSEKPWMQFGSWSSHDLYAQIAAEQGAVGLVAFAALATALLAGPLLRILRREERAPFVDLVFVSAAGGLCYGLFNYPLLLPPILAVTAIGLGIAAAERSPGARRPIPRRALLAVAAVALGLMTIRSVAAIRRGPVPGYASGVHEWDPYRKTRWTDGSALFVVASEGGTLRIPLDFPAPAALGPQKVAVYRDGEPWTGNPVTDQVFLDLPLENRERPTILQLRAERPFRPCELGLSADCRRLGVRHGPISRLR